MYEPYSATWLALVMRLVKMQPSGDYGWLNTQRLVKEQQGEQDIAALLNWQQERNNKDKP
ncbi:MAG: hypothetical protein R3F38_19015 [Gammaproteobacteria bacterium]